MHRVEILLLRHGTSKWNKEKIHQGKHKNDPGLAEEGVLQVNRTGEFLQDEPILAVWTSPLPRARQSATLIHKKIKGYDHIPVIHDFSLMEISHGVADGMPFAKIKELFPERWKRWENRIYHEPIFPDGEIPAAAQERGYSKHRIIAEISVRFKRYSENPDGKILIMSHGALNNFVLCKISDTSLHQGWEKFPQDNCCINRILWDDQKKQFEILTVNETAHLGELKYTPLVEI